MSKFLDLDGVKSLWSAVKSAISSAEESIQTQLSQGLSGKQDTLGLKSDGDARKYLNEQGQFTVPDGSGGTVAGVESITLEGVYIVDEKGNIGAFVGPDSDNVVNTIGYRETTV